MWDRSRQIQSAKSLELKDFGVLPSLRLRNVIDQRGTSIGAMLCSHW
jgi:hypothetical protein